jgi:hypothetical protein
VPAALQRWARCSGAAAKPVAVKDDPHIAANVKDRGDPFDGYGATARSARCSGCGAVE